MSEERSKGISLRTKRKGSRPVISAPKQISNPIKQDGSLSQAGSSVPNVQQRPQLGAKTSDLVKRRYSTRYNNLPTDFDATAPPVPAVPSIPANYVAHDGHERGLSPSRDQIPAIDVNALRDPAFSAEQYVAGMLGGQSLTTYHQTLQRVRNRTSMDLQQNVYLNRTQFIKISKEAEKLKAEMRALKNLMSELKMNTTALRAASSTNNTTFENNFSTTTSKRDRRNSVADRTAMWNSQLQALWKNVEGSQRYLPAAEGRHVIQNAGVWVELDNATWKSRRSMQIILLNDHLLVASRKKKKIEAGNNMDPRQAPSKLVADRCWPLLDIEVVDLAGVNEPGSSRNKVVDAIMIRGIGQESFTYRTDKGEDTEKAVLLSNYRKAVEELRRGLRNEIVTNNKAHETMNYIAARDPGLLRKTELLETLSDIKDRPKVFIEVDGKQQNLRWVEGQVDELDIDIALQRIDDAVDRVEKLNSLCKGLKNNAVAQDFINYKTEERSSRLADLISRELIQSHNELKKTKQNVSWLTRLGYEDRAREAYLKARSTVIQKRSRQCVFDGNLNQYIWEVSFVYFTIIRNTVAVYQACFPTLLMSACVKWAKEQVETFNAILARQLSSVKTESAIWQDCMQQARGHAEMLSEVGLDFRSFSGQNVDAPASADVPVGLGLI